MLSKKRIASIVAMGVLVSLVSCVSVNTATYDASSNRQMGFKTGDTFLNESVYIKDVVVNKNSNGNMTVNVLFQNMLYTTLNLEVKVEFYDASGVVLDDPWGYKPMSIMGQQEKWEKFISISNKATSYTISFMSPKN